MWATVTMGELVAIMALFAVILSATAAVVSALAMWMRRKAAQQRALKALYIEIELNTAALERWDFDVARARRDRAPTAFAPRKAVFASLGVTLHETPQPSLERALDFYAALETLERMSIQATLNTAPGDSGDAFAALKPMVEMAAAQGRRAMFSFAIEGAVPAVERPKPVATPKRATAGLEAPELKLAQAA
ncbi:MAG: hypothetical protein MRY74_17455 [Neomegalonema sp.]|nr:hypothetical protein [Neomegalonema sp.]